MRFDYAIAGGGLQGVLCALAIRKLRPEATVVLVEGGESLGGNHTWSFHAGDIPDGARCLVEPLISARWPAYTVAFPDRQRRVDEPYASISSERLDTVGRDTLGERVLLRTRVARATAGALELEDGRLVAARLVIDARGPGQLASQGDCAFQKFFGLELRVERAPELPVMMDARVPQLDGFRFFYVLPLASDRVLVEDTRFSLSPALDAGQLEREALAWADGQGLRGEVLRRELGVLPLPIETAPELPAGPPLRAGYGGGFFHPVTGYSFPAALRLALHVASRPPGDAFDGDFARLRAQLALQQRFGLLLNRLLYRAVPEEDRWRVLSRFHGLPAEVLRRFYALETTRGDRLRILCGRPPRRLSWRKALQALQA